MRHGFIVSMLLGISLAACASPEAGPEAAPTVSAETEEEPADPVSDAEPEAEPVEALPASLLDDLIYESESVAQDALVEVVAAGDESYIPVLIEVMRAGQIGIAGGADYEATIAALEELSGQSFGNNWPAWVEWYGDTDIEPPPGFTGWKGLLFSRIDRDFAQFLQDEHPSRIRVEEIMWGGVLLDGIPALDQPDMIPPEEASYLLPEEPVFGMEINGDARAYPLRIMDWHEMANDTIGDVPVSIAYCTLCGAAIAYDGRASDGTTYDFGSSGFLYRSNKLMYDRQTFTLWNQFTGEPVLGPLADQEITFDILPVVLTTWEDWLTQNPDTLVLSVDTGYRRFYEPGAAYSHYFASEDTMFPVWTRSDALPDKEQVYAVRVNGVPKAYALPALLEEQVVNDTVADVPLVVVLSGERVYVESTNREAGIVVYTPGASVRAYERGEYRFSPGDGVDTVIDEDGGEWRMTEEALIGPDDETLPRIGGHLSYWFGWFAFFPETEVYGLDGN